MEIDERAGEGFGDRQRRVFFCWRDVSGIFLLCRGNAEGIIFVDASDNTVPLYGLRIDKNRLWSGYEKSS